MPSKEYPRVFIGGDWDADGLIASALLVYSQEKLGLYPLKAKAIVEKKPVDPERIKFIIKELRGNYDLVVLLDLPYTKVIPQILKMLKQHFGVKKIMYVDHHLSTISNRDKLEEVVDELILDHKEPTASILYRILESNGVSVHHRLKAFVEVVKYMDSGRRVPEKYLKLFELTSSFSKALTVLRDEKIWEKLVDWLASPTPLPMPLDQKVLERVKKAIEKRDREIEEKALDLAMGARKIGPLRFVDARQAWKHRGGTALASKIASILKSPVVVLVDTNKSYSLLIIKASGGRAYRIAKYLVGEGIGMDIAGHPNLAIIRVAKNIDVNELVDVLYKAVYYST